LANNTAQSLDLVSLDYDTIKASLKSYLAAQPEFQAYDFDQGGLAAVVKLLAYSSCTFVGMQPTWRQVPPSLSASTPRS